MTPPLPTRILCAAAEAGGITVAQVATSRDPESIAARQLAAWLLSALTGWPIAKLGEAFERDDQAMRSLLQRAHNRRRRDPIWRAKADRLLTRLRKAQNQPQPEPGQLELSLPGDIPREECSSWGFAEARPKAYFAQLNARAVSHMARALEEERAEAMQGKETAG